MILLLAWTLHELIENRYIAQPIKLPASHNPVELYSNQMQDNLAEIYQHAIQDAKESITLVIYALTDPQITQALQKKSEAGVQIHIVCDAKASPGIIHHLPRVNIVRRFGQGLMHQKILIIDNKQIWLGSANMTPSSLNIHDNLVVGLEHRAFAEALTKRARSMDEEGGYHPLLHLEANVGSQNVELWVLPDDPKAVQRMIKFFRSAQKSIQVAMFTWTRVDFAQEMIAAAKRGIKVEVVIDRYSGKGASSKIIHLFEKEGINVRLSTGNKLLHHKFAYIDEKILVNGSANWTNAAFKSNDDYFIALYPLLPEQKIKLNKLWSIIIKGSESPHIAINRGKGKKQWHPIWND